ncbi:MAG TPA: RluA family pseudouridine synthase [Ruminococcus sp.]|nr:RluA family pseudouridine synthase [Ruminococcus sp.]
MRKFIINSNDCGQRADKFIMKVSDIPKSLMYKFIRTKKIKLKRKKFEISYKLQEGDIMEFYVDDSFFHDNDKSISFSKATTDINIIYEDSNIMIISKPAGVIVHSDKNNTGNTLADSVKNYLYKKGEYDPFAEASFAPAVCNRLDRNTCGIVIAAKNAAALREVNEIIRLGKIHKKYLCIAVNCPEKPSGTIKAYHFKDDKLNKVFISDTQKTGYKQIITKYRVIENKNNLCLIEAELITGRSHQIRASLAHIGCPLLGDTKYGIKSANDRFKTYYQALCAYSLKFDCDSNSELGYLNNREFKIDMQDIWFSKIFYGKS